MVSFNLLALSTSLLAFAASTIAIDPAAIYDGGLGDNSTQIRLRIGNGGAGQSGLVKGSQTRSNTYCIYGILTWFV